MTSNLHQAQSHNILRSWQSQRNDTNQNKDFVLPMFIGNKDDAIESIDSMPEVYRYGCNSAIDYLEPLVNKYGLRSILLFPVVTKTDRMELNNDDNDDDDDDDDEDNGDRLENSSVSNDADSSCSIRSTSDNSSMSTSDDDCGQGSSLMPERLLNEDQLDNVSLNPFLAQANEEEEDHLLAGEQGNDTNHSPAISTTTATTKSTSTSTRELTAETLLSSSSSSTTTKTKTTTLKPALPRVAPPKPPPRANEDVTAAATAATSAAPPLMNVSQAHDIRLIKGMALKDKYNPVLRLIPKIRAKFPKLLIICDVCLCAFTSTGHCCLFEDHSRAKNAATAAGGGGTGKHMLGHFPISNKITCQYLAMLSVEYARRGCDVIAPSDMMDGRILTIRAKLNENGLYHVPIMSYSAKFASAYYGPFRQATNNAPEFGDRRAYQLPPGSRALAAKAVQRDIDQGADFVMVKPGGLYLDIVRDIRNKHPDVPIAIYQVSGEYSMLKMAAKTGLIDLKLAVNETLTAFRRAGVTIIISYFTPEILRGEFQYDD